MWLSRLVTCRISGDKQLRCWISSLLPSTTDLIGILEQLPEGTELTAWISGSEFIAEAFGTAASIAEVGEQLAWLSASLRSSRYTAGITFITPSIKIIRPESAPENVKTRMHNPNVQCRITFSMEKGEQGLGNGQCWHGMFRNPVLVPGFPVLRRPRLDTGLEIPLNMMSALASTRQIDEFNDKIFIKGFSTMLIPTDFSDGVVIWHLQYRTDGGHISYYDACVPHVSVNASDVEQSRNIVGWCSQADLLAGMNAHFKFFSKELSSILLIVQLLLLPLLLRYPIAFQISILPMTDYSQEPMRPSTAYKDQACPDQQQTVCFTTFPYPPENT